MNEAAMQKGEMAPEAVMRLAVGAGASGFLRRITWRRRGGWRVCSTGPA